MMTPNYKKMRHLIIIFLLGAGIFSCEDVVDIDVDDAPALLVVDAFLNNKAEAQTIKLRRSQTYFDANSTPGVTGAEIGVLSSTGEVFIFEDQGNGDYVWEPDTRPSLGEVGDDFNLGIELDGKTYLSFSPLNRVPPIDSITQVFEEETSFNEASIDCNFFSRDPVGTNDTYWIKTFKNDEFLGKPLEMNFAYDAGFSPGAEVDGLIFIPPIRDNMNPVLDDVEAGEKFPSPWAVGDTARVEIHSISLEVFFFLSVARDELLNSLNGIFAEPVSNTQGNVFSSDENEEVLGVFVVSAISELEYEIQEP